ncbi:FixH family protein [Gracilibacillus sp. YIM 98692]|uniref:FixH family protein n=1 Tax=Gracilibacillus sp. YIM 98692 TaxID=2663532 RepID=UPI0013D2A6F8|nr:FixH family protein [Gracilibacillus sp. YIM 98692]
MKIHRILIVFLLFLTACGNNAQQQDEQEELKELTVNFHVPETAEAGENVTLEAKVTYGEEPVTDAEYVQFEYWHEDDEEHSTTVEAQHQEGGNYTADISFSNSGTYEIYAHTQARQLHTMPKKSIVIEGDEEKSTDEAQHSDEHTEEEDHHHHHDQSLSIDLEQANGFVKSETAKFTIHLQMDHEPLTDANVRLELFTDESEKHIWIDAEELEDGTYVGSHEFQQVATYTSVIHVTSDNGLHEHKEYDIQVKNE